MWYSSWYKALEEMDSIRADLFTPKTSIPLPTHVHCLSDLCATCFNIFRLFPEVLLAKVGSFSVPWVGFVSCFHPIFPRLLQRGKNTSHDTLLVLLILSILRWMKPSPSQLFLLLPWPGPGLVGQWSATFYPEALGVTGYREMTWDPGQLLKDCQHLGHLGGLVG